MGWVQEYGNDIFRMLHGDCPECNQPLTKNDLHNQFDAESKEPVSNVGATGMTLKKAMDTLRTKAAELNKLTDEAAVSVRLVEKFLNEECSAGIIAYVETHYEKMTLGYNRYNGSFRIVVKAGDDEKPWNEQNRTVKLNTVASLPRLVAAVAEETGRMLKRYEQSVATTKEILESIFKKG